MRCCNVHLHRDSINQKHLAWAFDRNNSRNAIIELWRLIRFAPCCLIKSFLISSVQIEFCMLALACSHDVLLFGCRSLPARDVRFVCLLSCECFRWVSWIRPNNDVSHRCIKQTLSEITNNHHRHHHRSLVLYHTVKQVETIIRLIWAGYSQVYSHFNTFNFSLLEQSFLVCYKMLFKARHYRQNCFILGYLLP